MALVVVRGALGDAGAASAGSARCDPAPGSGTSHRRTARRRARAGPDTGRRRRGPSRRTAGPWTASSVSWRCGCSPNARQIRDDRGLVQPDLGGHRARRPVRRVARRALQRLGDHLLDLRVGDLARLPRPRLIQQPIQPELAQTADATCRPCCGAPPAARRSRVLLSPLGRRQHDPRPQRQRAAAVLRRRVHACNSSRSSPLSSIGTAAGLGTTESYYCTETNDSRH